MQSDFLELTPELATGPQLHTGEEERVTGDAIICSAARKLMRSGRGWLPAEPLKRFVARRYDGHDLAEADHIENGTNR